MEEIDKEISDFGQRGKEIENIQVKRIESQSMSRYESSSKKARLLGMNLRKQSGIC